jgi:cytochrome c biogenesis protein CcmG, thiol:disulfide interchange protein DsbE
MNRTVLFIGAPSALALIVLLVIGLGVDPAHIKSPLIDKPAPPFALVSAGTHETIDLEQLRGKPVVVNFWATWCMPCYEEHPILVNYARNAGSDAQFIGIVFNDEEKRIMQFLSERGSAYPTLMDTQGKTAIAYGVGGVPETYFINRQGVIVAKHEGPITPDKLGEYIAKASQ